MSNVDTFEKKYMRSNKLIYFLITGNYLVFQYFMGKIFSNQFEHLKFEFIFQILYVKFLKLTAKVF